MNMKKSSGNRLLLSIINLFICCILLSCAVFGWLTFTSSRTAIKTVFSDFDMSVAIYRYDKESVLADKYVLIPNEQVTTNMEKIGLGEREVYKIVIINNESTQMKINFCFEKFSETTKLDAQICFFALSMYSVDPIENVNAEPLTLSDQNGLYYYTTYENWLSEFSLINEDASTTFYLTFYNDDYNNIDTKYLEEKQLFETKYESELINTSSLCSRFITFINAMSNGYDTDFDYSSATDEMKEDMNIVYTWARAWHYVMYDIRWPVTWVEPDESGWIGFGRLSVPQIVVLAERV